MILNILGSDNISLAANIKNENLTTKSYVFDLDDLEGSEIKELYNLKEDEIPSKYNLKDKIELFVEDQKLTDLCDLYAGIKSIETNYALTTGSSVDLSERYMDYISSKYFYGDRELGTLNDSAAFAYASMYGVALESDVSKEVSDTSIIETAAPVCRVISTVDFKELDKTDETNLKLLNIIKEHLMKYGSLAVGVGSPDLVSGAYHNGNDAYYYKTGIMENEIRPNHQVSIVGWDDSYSRNNFNKTPDRDGAFICLNSWGKDWGQEGFFYVSYDTLSEFEGLSGVIKTEDYIEETEYTYAEGLYTTGSIMEATRENKYYGVVFDTKTKGEYLKHITLEMTGNPSKIKLYCNPYDENFDSGKYIYLGETANSFWGNTLMYWEDPIELKGEKFALVFEINYDDDMNDDFINNVPSLTHSTHETIGGHFYNSSKIDSGFELLDYDLQLFVYTIAQNPMDDTITYVINDNDTKENHVEKNHAEKNNAEENNAEENHAEKIKENSGKAEGFSIDIKLITAVAVIVFIVIVVMTVKLSQKKRNE